MEKIFVIFSAKGLSLKISEMVWKGDLNEANRLYWGVKSYHQKVISWLQERGQTAISTIPDFLACEVSEKDANDIPLIYEGFKESTGGLVACGIGLDYQEAAKAMARSSATHELEMFDPKMNKAEGFDWNLPINTTDPKTQEHEKLKPNEPEKAVLGPNAENSMKLESLLLQAIAQQISPPQPQQPQPQQQDPNAPQKSLYETVTGGAPQGQQAEPEKKAEAKPEGETEDDKPEEKGHLDKLGESLVHIKEQIPQLMDLADKNPEAFKQAMALVQKMLSVVKSKVKKSETSELEDLVKKINTFSGKYPVGTVKGKKKKLIVNGKAVWRSMGAGAVKDAQGNPVSVKAHNKDADGHA